MGNFGQFGQPRLFHYFRDHPAEPCVTVGGNLLAGFNGLGNGVLVSGIIEQPGGAIAGANLLNARYVRDECGINAGRMRDVLVFSSYSARVSLVFCSYSPGISLGRPERRRGGGAAPVVVFDSIGRSNIQTSLRFPRQAFPSAVSRPGQKPFGFLHSAVFILPAAF
ncbi:MAG: hypothetical protein ACLQU3_15840 [Limisphaerales bacterium]